jgi:hypothetical protein
MVRLKSHQPDGTRVGERDRTCHLVPISESSGMPEVLRAYCGVPILPGGADLLFAVTGMPCAAVRHEQAPGVIYPFVTLGAIHRPSHPRSPGWTDAGQL